MTYLVLWLRRLAWTVITRWPNVIEDRQHAWEILVTCLPQDDEIDAAIRGAFQDAGVGLDTFAPEMDLGTKRFEVLHHAAIRLGNPIRTVADLKGLLQ